MLCIPPPQTSEQKSGIIKNIKNTNSQQHKDDTIPCAQVTLTVCDWMKYLVFNGSRSLGKTRYRFTKASTNWFSLWKIWRSLIMKSFWPMGLSLFCTNQHKPGICLTTKTNEPIRTSQQLPSRKFAAHSLHSILFSTIWTNWMPAAAIQKANAETNSDHRHAPWGA